ncbi:MAG: MFS transporter [Acholeplasmatales bacterium]|jgi:Na+/melibiose symporter-like transporter|nr:MFS transporter [Acholeplasmatales bacterium]
MKRYKILDKGWKEILFSLTAFGPNLMMVILGAYFDDAINPVALITSTNPFPYQAISVACLIMPAIFPVIWMIAKGFDGLIDIPLAAFTDNLKTKWGNRRLPIAIGFIPMILSFVLLWVPVAGTGDAVTGAITQNAQIINTIWFSFWGLVFFTAYTMVLISYYGSISQISYDDKQRNTISTTKSIFDTLVYCFAYALIPLLLNVFNLHINQLVFFLVPSMLTIVIPLFLIKEGDKFNEKLLKEGYEIQQYKEPQIKIIRSIGLTFKNKIFVKWLIVNCLSYFGLQLFLSSMNSLIIGGMGLSDVNMAILNTAAFAPVPLMLYFFNKLKNKRGIRIAFQISLACFSVCILSFFFGSTYFLGNHILPNGDTNYTILYAKLAIGIVGGIAGSWSIGSFFLMPLFIPSQIASVEEKLVGRNHSAMFFAVQAFVTSIVGAVSGNLIFGYIRQIFVNKNFTSIAWATNVTDAAAHMNLDPSQVYNFGNLMVPFIVSLFCALGFIACFWMPKHINASSVAKELKLEKELSEHPELLESNNSKFEEENIVLNIILSVLSAFIFVFIWRINLIKTIDKIKNTKTPVLLLILSFIPIANAFVVFIYCKKMFQFSDFNKKSYSKLWPILCLVFGLLLLNPVSLGIIQYTVNKSIRYQTKLSDDKLTLMYE